MLRHHHGLNQPALLALMTLTPFLTATSIDVAVEVTSTVASAMQVCGLDFVCGTVHTVAAVSSLVTGL